MTDQDRLVGLLREALPPSAAVVPSRDLWPAVLSRSRTRVEWSWLDLSLAAGVFIALSMSPDWLWLLAFHL